ncbi:GMP synthase-like glutamine amidotransferase [Rhodovulum iodosum]|uniref:GMP synthase-like glutamine amidotransferase n=1 Tax=Rhodovulum iodosum TaxID=68291 RepID=A0ABV3XNW5_9RHOB|nr:type 1 glutamine amidotransferase [Rhodovulum robiginosum]RSK37953.1 type 1 glutamine amidotransferase [Rhodovulum robiginosum]
MQIGILETGHAPDALRAAHGDYSEMIARMLGGEGFSFRAWNVEAMAFPDSVHAAEGWLITGSRHGVYDDLPFIPPLEEFVRAAIAENVPIVGICFGHQIIARALGGRVEKFAGGWEVGPTEYEIEGQSYRLQAWHQDQVITPPDGAETVGTAPGCAHAALIYGDRAYSVQPHPEYGPAFIEGLMQVRAPGVVPPDRLAAARAVLDRSTAPSSARMAARMAAFLRREEPAP